MGNQTARAAPYNTRNKNKNRYSLDTSAFNNYKQSKILPSSIYSKQIGSSIDLKNLQQSKNDSINQQLNSSTLKQPSSIAKKSLSNTQQQAKLQKLTKTNDELRKQLMKISEQLTQKLKKKKKPLYQSKRQRVQSEEKTQNNKKNQFKIVALKKQLQNGYRQIDRYKKQIEQLKKNTPDQPNRKQQQLQQKMNLIDHQINDSLKQIQSVKAVLNHQQNGLKLFQNDEDQDDIIQVKRQIEQLKDRLKRIKKTQRKKQENEKKKGEYMIQLQRKLRQQNGEYLPQFKNYSNKNFKPQNSLSDKKKKGQEGFRYLPSKIQIDQAEKELQQLKIKHEEYHTKIQKALKSKADLKNQRQRIKDRMFQIQKNVEFLYYKKDRYMQLVMGNISHLSSQDLFDKSDLSHSDQQNGQNAKVVVKGQDVQGQVPFDDHSIFKGKSLDKMKIVTANVWLSTDGIVTALQFYYTDQDNFYIGNRSTLRTQNQEQKITFQLGQGDFLRNIMGIWNKKKYLELLVLQSYKGKVKKFGKESINGKNFNLGLSKLQRPSCANGASIYDGKYWRINKIQFQISS